MHKGTPLVHPQPQGYPLCRIRIEGVPLCTRTFVSSVVGVRNTSVALV